MTSSPPAARPAAPSPDDPWSVTSVTERAASGLRALRRARPFPFDVAVVGLGSLGLATALAHHGAGRSVLGLASPARVAAVRTLLVGDDAADGALAATPFLLTSDPGDLAGAAAVIVCVPRAADRARTPDPAPLQAACALVVARAVPGQLVVLTSATRVGGTEDLLVRPLTARGLVPGRDVLVALAAEPAESAESAEAGEAAESAERAEPREAAAPAPEASGSDGDGPFRVVAGATDTCADAAEALLAFDGLPVRRVPTLSDAESVVLGRHTAPALPKRPHARQRGATNP